MVVGKKMLCKRMLKFLKLSDVVSLENNDVRFFVNGCDLVVRPLYHECSFLAKLLQSARCCQSFPFDALCDVILNEIVEFTIHDLEAVPWNSVSFVKNSFFRMNIEEAEVFLDMNEEMNEDARV